MAEIRGNKAVEDAAIAWVMEIERRAGRGTTATTRRVRRTSSVPPGDRGQGIRHHDP
jgi:hypothetical protein